MLYLSYRAKKYTRPPSSDPPLAPYFGNPNFMSYAKLCDIELTFLTTSRAYPNPGEVPPVPNNANYIVGGHNLAMAISIDRNWHYYQTTQQDGQNFDVSLGRPFWYSFPLELLFMDPDIPQPDASCDGPWSLGGQLLL
jgi:hypothetical protein